MKKFLLLMFSLFVVLALSGCGNEYTTTAEAEEGRICSLMNNNGISEEYWCDYYYTQEEVDEIIDRLWETYLTNDEYNIDLDDIGDYIQELEQRIEELENTNYVTEAYLYADFQDSFGEMILDYLEETYQPLEECDIDCDIQRINNEIFIATIGMIDILIYQYENTTEELTEEDELVYNLLLMQKQELIGEIE